MRGKEGEQDCTAGRNGLTLIEGAAHFSDLGSCDSIVPQESIYRNLVSINCRQNREIFRMIHWDSSAAQLATDQRTQPVNQTCSTAAKEPRNRA